MPASAKDTTKETKGFTSLADMFDGGGMGGSGSEYSTQSHEQYKQDYRDEHGHDDPNAVSHTSSSSQSESSGGGFTSFADMFDGGGMGGSGSESSTKSHDQYKEDYRKKHGEDDPYAKSHYSGSSDGGKPTGSPDIGLTVVETKTGLKIEVVSATGVKVTVKAPAGTPHDVIKSIAQAALDYADAVKGGYIFSEKTFTTIDINIADLDGANGAFYPSSGKIEIDYTPGDPRTVGAITATTVHELTHKYNPSLHRTDAGAPTSDSHHSQEFYEAVDKAAAALDISPLRSGTKHSNASGALPYNGHNYPTDQTIKGPRSDEEIRDAFYDYLGYDHPPAHGTAPILLDLDGNGVRITEFDRSNIFMDADGDGLKSRTSWAGAGDGVLFFDAGNDGQITEKREYVFTEWDPSADSDFAALRSRFDSNGDGKLTAADAEFASFKVMVTNADGSQTAMTLAQLGITEINLTPDTTKITLPDGSGNRVVVRAAKRIAARRWRGAPANINSAPQAAEIPVKYRSALRRLNVG